MQIDHTINQGVRINILIVAHHEFDSMESYFKLGDQWKIQLIANLPDVFKNRGRSSNLTIQSN